MGDAPMRRRLIRFFFLLAATSSAATASWAAPPTRDPARIPRVTEMLRGKGTRLLPQEKEKLIAEKQEQANQKRTQAIKLLEDVLASEPSDEAASEGLFKLAELYWEDSRLHYAAAMAEYDKKTEACKNSATHAANDATCKLLPPILDVTRSEKLYLRLAQRFPRYPRIDIVLYLLGFGAHQENRGKDAVVWFQKLIDEHPGSPLLPDAWMMVGEHWFDSDFGKARAAYGHVLEHKSSPVYDLALFKTAWCEWKLGDTKRAAERFKEVLDIASAAEKTGTEASKRRSSQLRDEALEYLTLLFTEDENVTAKDAYEFLASIGGERYSREILDRLADMFYGQSRFDRAVQAWQFMIVLDPTHPDAPRFQLRVIDSFLAMGQSEDAVAAAKELATRFGPGSDWAKAGKASASQIEKTNGEIETALGDLGKRMHGEAQLDEQQRRRPDLGSYKRAADLYAFYLSRFGKSPRATEVRFLRAEILYFKLNQLEEAGDEYLAVGKLKPVGNRTKDALLKAMAAYEKLRPKDIAGQRRKLTAADHKFADAVDTFANTFQGDKEVVGVIYRNGQMFFDYGEYDNAVKRFGLIVTKYPDDPNAGAAGDRILEALARSEDYANIEDWAKKLKGARSFKDPKEQQRLDEIIVQAIGKQAEKQVKDGKNEEASATFLRAAKEYPSDRRAAASVYKAGRTMETAQQPIRAAEIYLSLVERYPRADEAPQGAFAAGQAYENMAYFDKAAEAYAIVAYRFPDNPKASDALFNVAVLAQALGQTQEAIKADNEYARRYPKQKDIEDVSFRVGMVYADARDPARAAAAYDAFVRRYSDSKRVVEAHTRAARAYLDLKQPRRAEEEVQKTLARWRSFSKASQKEMARWAAEAKYLEGEFVFQEYQQISLEVKPKQLKSALDRKRTLLAKAQLAYTDVVQFGDPTWATAALLRIGQIYEQFADQLRKLPSPPDLTPEEKEVYQQELERYEVDMEDKAASIYETGYKKALDFKIYGNNTRLLREGLARLAQNRFPQEREVRARSRVGDKAPEVEIVKDVARD
jgi:TolA-binding protein